MIIVLHKLNIDQSKEKLRGDSWFIRNNPNCVLLGKYPWRNTMPGDVFKRKSEWFLWDGHNFLKTTINENEYKTVARCLTEDLYTALSFVSSGNQVVRHDVIKTQWSSKYSECINCGTTEVKYVSLGLCENCFSREIDKIPITVKVQNYSKERWSLKYAECVNCGTTEVKHKARGLCVKCYDLATEQKHKLHKRKRGLAGKILTEEYLYNEYVVKRKSLGDIAKESYCSRQNVYKKLKRYMIDTRSKEDARVLALVRNKVSYTKIDENGNEKEVLLEISYYKKDFFKTWSAEMAYLLGLIYTDGHLDPGRKLDPSRKTNLTIPRVTLTQKEPEILHKAVKLLESNAKILFRKRRVYSNTVAGELYYFHINSESIYFDLLKLGLTPKKSLTLRFPSIPLEYVRHFIRGCWDGDGSVYIEKDTNKLVASFVSGSFDFIRGICDALEREGFRPKTIHQRKGKNVSYYFKIHGKECLKLYHYFYDGVPSEQYLTRKYLIFSEHLP
jgi:hypothetical protein